MASHLTWKKKQNHYGLPDVALWYCSLTSTLILLSPIHSPPAALDSLLSFRHTWYLPIHVLCLAIPSTQITLLPNTHMPSYHFLQFLTEYHLIGPSLVTSLCELIYPSKPPPFLFCFIFLLST